MASATPDAAEVDPFFFTDGPQPRAARPGPAVPVPPAAPTPAERPPGQPRRRLSLLRLVLALAVLAGGAYGGYIGVQPRLAAVPLVHQTWFAPYVDVTLTPTYQFQSTSADPARQTALGFVVADPKAGCTPSWGAAYTLTQADQSLALGSRIEQLQQDGEQPIVSFGGQSHTSLDVACASVPGLTAAYQSVIDSYKLTAIDLDIEGAALSDFPAEERRATAIADLEQAARAAHRQLDVWLTLPVEPSGLQDNALSVISSMLRDGVSVTGINVMTMDFAQPPAAGSGMLPPVRAALNATHAQLADLFPRYGIHLRSQQIWQRMGATVMIGQNNVGGENFTVSDAQGLVEFRRREPSRPDIHVVAEPGRPVRLFLPRERAAVRHVQRHRPVQPAVLADLRPVAGGRLGHLHGRERPARRGQHQPGGCALSAVVRPGRLPVRVQGRGGW